MDTSCPYGAGECPKIKSLYDMISKQGSDIEDLNSNVIQLTTTVKNTAYALGIIITIVCAFIGVLVI